MRTAIIAIALGLLLAGSLWASFTFSNRDQADPEPAAAPGPMFESEATGEPSLPVPDPVSGLDTARSQATDEPYVSPKESGFYDENWNIVDFWPGEWPDGFTVTGDYVVLMGREEPRPGSPAIIACPLPSNMNVNPWNDDRVATENWAFKSAQYRSRITMLEDAELVSDYSGPKKTLEVEVGDVLRHEAYYSEGYFLASFEGEEYELNESDLTEIASFEQSPDDDLWVRVTCHYGKGGEVWLLLSEVQRQRGIGPVSFDAFGEASDLDIGPNDITR
ncbi:MAG: hypothetical protein AAGA24_01455 [Pseudomonadota bacterium]